MNRLLLIAATAFIAPFCTFVKSRSISSAAENGMSPPFGRLSLLLDVGGGGAVFSKKETSSFGGGGQKMERVAVETMNVDRFGDDRRSKKNGEDVRTSLGDHDGSRGNDHEEKIRKRHTFHRFARETGFHNVDLEEQEGDYRPREQQTQQPVAIRGQPKREKQGVLIAALCIVVIVLVITVGVVLYVFFYYHPERDMEDLMAEYRLKEGDRRRRRRMKIQRTFCR